MTLALILAAYDPSDNVGASDVHAEGEGGRDDVGRAAARDRRWAEVLCAVDVVDAQHALTMIMHEYADRLVRFAYGFVRSMDGAEDIVQDVFVRVWDRRETIRPEESLRAYLFTAVRRAALDVLKRRAVEARYAARVEQEEPASSVLLLHDQMDADVVAERVRMAMERLPERRRTALRLRYEEQLPFAVVAMVMGVSEKAAKHLVARGVSELRGHLGL
jgi:RNA polymerase sigma-70 factor (ECF subfamily)